MNLDELFVNLDEYLQTVEGKFLTAHIENPLAAPDDYDFDVKSYCILCHAAFEGFVEEVVRKVTKKAIDDYKTNKRLSLPIICLLHFKSDGGSYLTKDGENLSVSEIESTFDYLRPKLEEVLDVFSKEIYNNHGFALKYLRKLFIPIGVDIPKNPIFHNSLEKLSKERGVYAHKYLEHGSIRRSIAPEDAKAIVKDCAQLCKELKNRSVAILS